jgi:hypothetical protein
MGFTIYDLRLTRKQTRNSVSIPAIIFHQAQHFLAGLFQPDAHRAVLKWSAAL